MSFRSANRSITDRVFARPTWLERNGRRAERVYGFSLADNLAAAGVGLLVLTACVVTLALLS